MPLFCTGVGVREEGEGVKERETERKREQEHAGAEFLKTLSNKGPITKTSYITALLRQSKKRNKKSKSFLCHFRCWASIGDLYWAYVQHQTAPHGLSHVTLQALSMGAVPSLLVIRGII